MFLSRFVTRRASQHAHVPSFTYVHPLSEACLSELKNVSPKWFNPADINYSKDGSFELKFHVLIHEKRTHGLIKTLYDVTSRHHFLLLEFGQLQGRVSLMDGSKSAWQSNIGGSCIWLTELFPRVLYLKSIY